MGCFSRLPCTFTYYSKANWRSFQRNRSVRAATLPLPPPRRGTGLFAGDGAATVNWELADAQKAALALALRQRFLIISGGPGTGKTTSVLTILRCLARLGCQPQRMLLAAPTGRAAYRLTDSIRGGLRALQESAGALPKPDDALLGLEACTIHRLLQYRPSRHDFAHHAGNPLQADVIVIDEVSMVDAGLMASLLEALPPEARLIFLGDKDQLPSVEAGAMLADLIPQTEAPNYSADTAQWVRTVAQVQWPPLPSPPAGEGGVRVPQGEPQDHVVVLTQNYRVADTNIVEAVKCLTGLPSQKAIEAGLFAKRAFPQPVGDAEDDSKTLSCLWPADAPGATGYHFIELTPEWASRGHWSRLLQSWAWHHYLRSAGFQPAPRGEGGRSYRDLLLQAAAQADFHRFDCISPELARDILSCVRNAQILTILRHGRFGCTRVNAVLMQYLAPKLDRYPAPGWFSGLPILITRNDYEMNLFNGDSGVILRDRNGLYRALFERRQLSAGIECLALDRLPPWEPALAITVHKSQGSEYAEVLLVVPPADAAETPAEELPAPRLLTAEILYTGLTRARRLALLCGTKSVVMQAATRRVERASGLAQGRHEGMKDEG